MDDISDMPFQIYILEGRFFDTSNHQVTDKNSMSLNKKEIKIVVASENPVKKNAVE